MQKLNKRVLMRKSVSYSKDAEVQNMFLTLPEDLSLNEKEILPFWNDGCLDAQDMLWLPQDVDGVVNYSSEDLFWKTTLTPKKVLDTKNLEVSLPKSLIPVDDSSKDVIQIATKKIRFYPENENAYKEALVLYRRAYNLATARFKDGSCKDENGKFVDMRPSIRDITEDEQSNSLKAYNSNIVNEAVRSAGNTFRTVCSKNKNLKGSKSGFAEMSYKSRKGTKHSFNLDKMPKGLSPCIRVLGKIHLTEEVPQEAILKSCTITLDKGRWFLQVQQHIIIKPEIQGNVKCVGVDPGVRTFVTCFSEDEVIIAGDKFVSNQLYPLMTKLDKLISQKQKLLNSIEDKDRIPQWISDRLKHVEKCMAKLSNRRDDLIKDLHNRVAYDLVTKFDVIFLPTFETTKMIKRKGKIRTIRRNTCRQMNSLNHYSFKMRLKWYAKKYGKHVVEVNESYTSKTRSWDGTIDEKLGSSKIIKGTNFIVDRDINAARNILIKHLTR